MDKVAVLIPCYNEEKTIGKVVRDFKEALKSIDHVIYVYDNNSTDNTVKIAKKAGAVIRHEYAQGKGNVIRRMFREIDAECYLMVDGDDTYPAEHALDMVNLVLEKQADMVVGDRLSSTYFQENKRPFHNFGNSLVRFSVNKLFNANIKDMMTGYRAFSYLFVKTYPVLSKGFKVIMTIIKLFKNYKPLLFFGAISLLLCIIGLILFLPILYYYLTIHLVPRFPTLIICGTIFSIAFVIQIAGIILDSLLAQDKRNFEFKLNIVQNWLKEKNK